MTLNPLTLYRRQKARKAFSEAFQRHRKAVNARDTRLIHTTRQALTKAQAERLKAGC